MSPVAERYGKPVQLDNVDANFSVAARTNGVAHLMRRALGTRIRRARYRTIPGRAFESRTSHEGVRRAFRACRENLDWRAQPRIGFATRAALRANPASFSASGRFMGFSILPAVVSAAPEEHYCVTAKAWRDFDVSGQDIASIIRRAWLPNSQEPASHSLQ